MNRRTTCAIVLLLATAPGAALAADPPKNGKDPAAAQALFYEARALMKQGKHAQACPKLEESLRLDHGIGTEFNLADCNEQLGKLASAWTGFLSVAALSKAADQKDRERIARQRAQALERRLPKLVVEVKDAPPGLQVRRDGVVLGSAAFGTAIPVDPGKHQIVVTAPGKERWTKTVEATEGDTERVSVPPLKSAAVAVAPTPAVPQATPASPPAESAAAAETTTTSSTFSFPEPVDERRSSAQKTIGWVVGGAGLVGLGVGGYFGLQSLDRRNTSDNHCTGDLCDARGVQLRREAIDAGNVATVATIAGGAAALGGLVLVLTAPKEHRVGLRAVPHVAHNGGGFILQGTLP
jgi:hypothetical protein